MARVFLSHASEDRRLAGEMHRWLTADGHKVFLDQDLTDGITVGDQWQAQLYERLRWADAYLCVVTADYVRSTWCTAEVAVAQSRGARLLPLVAEQGVVHPLLESIQHADYATDPLAARADHTTALWNVGDLFQPVRIDPPLAGHQEAVTSVAFGPDGRILATASRDRTVVVWDLTDRTGPVRLGPPLAAHVDAVNSVAFSPDGRTLASGSVDGDTIRWDLVELIAVRDHPVERACSLTGRGLDRDEWPRYISGNPYTDTCASQP